jgi:hypothetical protein
VANVPERNLTPGERSLLRQIFEITIPLDTMVLSVNDHDIGGKDNSITPRGVPWLSSDIWCADFSAETVSNDDRGTFIHECVHVWQYYHGITKLSAICLFARHLGHYELAYPYDLADSDDFTDFNIEQQASIIEDWLRITKGLRPLNNTGAIKTLYAYNRYVDQMRGAGLPHKPLLR